jgi:hypothetical protein
MGKYVIETVQVSRHKYYVEVDNPEWACDGVVCGDLDVFSSKWLTEDVMSITEVNEYPKADVGDSVNGAVCTFDVGTGRFKTEARWDLANEDRTTQ